MKVNLLITALGLLAVSAASAGETKIQCSGLTQTQEGRSQQVRVNADLGHREMEISFFSAEQAQPQPEETETYAITRINLMFPYGSIDARRDLRPVDGALTEVHLLLGDRVETGGRSKLTLEVTSLRGNVTRSSYDLICK
jgi:hypothetical protein